jgi:hypothetical protein
MKRNLNIFDRIGTLIPGYKGYQERDSRRECDRQLREQIADKLTFTEKFINSIITVTAFENLSEIEIIRKKINNLNALIKYSPYGESAFFSDSVIKETELEHIYQFDLNILDATNDLLVSADSNDLNAIKSNILLLEKSIIERNNYIKDK